MPFLMLLLIAHRAAAASRRDIAVAFRGHLAGRCEIGFCVEAKDRPEMQTRPRRTEGKKRQSPTTNDDAVSSSSSG